MAIFRNDLTKPINLIKGLPNFDCTVQIIKLAIKTKWQTDDDGWRIYKGEISRRRIK